MQKKIKNLTFQERVKICDEYCYHHCQGCPFRLELLDHKYDDKPYCVHHILNVLERKIEVK